jgi:uncharacterized RDD family membrane protein YckC
VPTPLLPPAGWFPDPETTNQLRFWDGTQWTGHTAAAPETERIQPILATASPAHLSLAGWWRRAAAWFIDSLVVGIPLYVIDILLGYIFYSHASAFVVVTHSPTAGAHARVIEGAFTSAATIAYAIWFLGHRTQTVGMSFVGIKAVDQSGSRLSRRQAWRRAFTEFALVGVWIWIGPLFSHQGQSTHGGAGVGGILGLLFVGGSLATYLWPLKSPLNQTLQDKAVGSIVVIDKFRRPSTGDR